MKKRIYTFILSAMLALTALALIACGEEVVEPTTYGVIAEFDKTKGNVTVTDSTHVEKRLFLPDETAIVTVTPKEGYVVKSFKLNGTETELPSSMKYTFTVNEPTRFIVTFEKPQSENPNIPSGPTTKKYSVKAEYDNTRGSVEISDMAGNFKNVFDENDKVKVTAKPKEDYSVLTATVDGVDLPFENGVLVFQVKSATTVKVNFTIKTYNITAQFDPDCGTVTVTDDEGEERTIFDKRQTVTVTATPEDTYGVYSVKVGNEQKTLDGNGKLTFTALADTVIKVDFVKIYNITAQFDSGLGTVKVCDSTGKEATGFFSGQTVKITTAPKEGNKVLAVTINGLTAKPAKTNAYTFTADEDVVFEVEFVPLHSPLETALTAAANATNYKVEVRGEDISCDIYRTQNAVYYYFDDEYYSYGYGYVNGEKNAREFFYSGDDGIELFDLGDCATEITAYYKDKIDLAAKRLAFDKIDSTAFRSKGNVYSVVFDSDIDDIYDTLTDDRISYAIARPDGITIELSGGKISAITYVYYGEAEQPSDDEDESEETQPADNNTYITFTYSGFGNTELPEELDFDNATTPLDAFLGADGTAIYVRGDDMITMDALLGVAVNGAYVDVEFDEDIGYDGCYTVKYLGEVYGLEKSNDDLGLVQGSGMSSAVIYLFTQYDASADIPLDLIGTWSGTSTHSGVEHTLVVVGKQTVVDEDGNTTVTAQEILLDGESLEIVYILNRLVHCNGPQSQYLYDITLNDSKSIVMKVISPNSMLPLELLTFTKDEPKEDPKEDPEQPGTGDDPVEQPGGENTDDPDDQTPGE